MSPIGRKGTERGRLKVSDWPAETRPRERLMTVGAKNLSPTELLAIVLGTGGPGRTTLELAQSIIDRFRSLGALSCATVEELGQLSGVGRAKGARLLAALELGRRVVAALPDERVAISGPEDVAALLMPEMRYLDREHFKALVLNTKNQLLKIADVSVGSLNTSVVHPRELFKLVISHSGAGVVVAHNHPSGDAIPSSDDVAITRRLVEGAQILGIRFVDHIILGDGSYVSLRERGVFDA